MRTMAQEIQILSAIAASKDLRLNGHILGIIKRAATGIEEIVIDQANTIHNDLKGKMRDTMNSNTDFAMDNLQATQVAEASLSASLNGKDGLFLYGSDLTPIITNALGFMASDVHPTEPFDSNPYYRQWQGVYQNLTGGSESAEAADMGQSYTHTPSSGAFAAGVIYATSDFANVTLLDNDIITINWKITVG